MGDLSTPTVVRSSEIESARIRSPSLAGQYCVSHGNRSRKIRRWSCKPYAARFECFRATLSHSPKCDPPVYGQISLIFGSFLPVNRGCAFRKAIFARKPCPVTLPVNLAVKQGIQDSPPHFVSIGDPSKHSSTPSPRKSNKRSPFGAKNGIVGLSPFGTIESKSSSRPGSNTLVIP